MGGTFLTTRVYTHGNPAGKGKERHVSVLPGKDEGRVVANPARISTYVNQHEIL
jgi:hypothetical protein